LFRVEQGKEVKSEMDVWNNNSIKVIMKSAYAMNEGLGLWKEVKGF